MSRSYKKYPLFRDNLWGKSMKKGKKISNKKIRKKLKNIDNDVGRGKDYIKYGLDKWELYEFKTHRTKGDTIIEWNKQQIEANNNVGGWMYKWLVGYTLEEAVIDWYKSYKMK